MTTDEQIYYSTHDEQKVEHMVKLLVDDPSPGEGRN